MRRLGVHVSISGGFEKAIDRAVRLGCTTFQIFSRSPRSWRRSDLGRGRSSRERFRRILEKHGIHPVFVHTPYLVNLASSDALLRKRSTEAVIEDIEISYWICADFVVSHPGSGEGKKAIKSLVSSLDRILTACESYGVIFLLENMAGQGRSLLSNPGEIRAVFETLGFPEKLGLCLDTCHLFASGVDIRDVGALERFCDSLGEKVTERIFLIHANDSKGDLGSRVDRHEHIGRGAIGFEGFKVFLNFPPFSHQPVILETPKRSEADDIVNLRAIREALKVE